MDNSRETARLELKSALANAIRYVRMAYAIKSVSSVVQTYLDDITRDFQDVLAGDLLGSEARRRHRANIKESAPLAYAEGLKEGGADGLELDDEEKAVIQSWIDNQLSYVGGLWDSIDKLANDYENAMINRQAYEAGRLGLYERIGLWGNALRELAGQGKSSALKNMPVTWKLGATEEHCRTCNRLNGKRHKLNWFVSRDYIPQAQASDTLECGGWRCQCTLVDDKGKQILPSA